MTGSKLLGMACGLMFGALLGTAEPVEAAAREGGRTDDSVCDLGRLYNRSSELPDAYQFVRTQCKNGQVLMAIAVVPAGNFDSQAKGVGYEFCSIAELQLRQFAGPVSLEFEEVRCVISKLPKVPLKK